MKITIEAKDMQEFVLGVKDLYELLYNNPKSPLDQGGGETKPEDLPPTKAPTTAPTGAKSQISLADAKTLVGRYIRENGNTKVKEVLTELGVPKISAIPEGQLENTLKKIGAL